MKNRDRVGLVWGVLCLFTIMGFVASAADIVVKEEPVPVNSFARVQIKIEKGQTVLWDVYPEPVTIEEFKTDVASFLHFSGPPGAKYKVVATVLTIKDGTIAADRQRKNVTIASGGGDVLPPDVDPEPEPVEPVVGGGEEKVGVSLTPTFRAALKKDSPAEKILLPKLITLYASYSSSVDDEKYKTWGDLEKSMRADAQKSEIAGKLPNTQLAIAAYLTKYLPGGKPDWEKVPLDSKGRKSAKTAFKNVSVALGAVK